MLEGVDAGNPESTAIGMHLVADFKEESEGEEKRVTLVFRSA